jgi:hypothetical protein
MHAPHNDFVNLSTARFIRRTSHVPNILQTIDNEAFQLIIISIVFNVFGTCVVRRIGGFPASHEASN